MSTDEKYNVKGLLSDLLAKAKGREGLDLVLLRDEIRKEIEAGDKTLDKFLELVESFQDVLPKEKQRYSVAIRALFTTSGVSRQNILESTNKQLEELRKLENGVLSDLTGFRDELTDMDSRLQETKSELTKLREKIADLEKEEREILRCMAAWERERKVVEDAVKKVFTDFSAEKSEIKKKIEEFTAEKGSPPTAHPDFIESHKHEEEEVGVEEEGKKEETSAMEEMKWVDVTSGAEETKWVKECPMCGGLLNFILNEAKWMCYTCGHEEAQKEET